MSKKQKVEKLEKDESLDTGNKSDELNIHKVPIEDIKQSDTFAKLFPRNPKVLEEIEEDMRVNGFEPAYPLITWNGIVVDGNCRLEKAKKLGITEVYIVEYTWETEEEALDYAIHCQRDRRNMTDAEWAILIDMVDELKKRGRKTDDISGDNKASHDAKSGKSAEITAEMVGTSLAKVEKFRRIKKQGGLELAEQVKTGKKTINAAHRQVVQQQSEKQQTAKKPANYRMIIKALDNAIKYCGDDSDLAQRLTDLKAVVKQRTTDTAKDK